MSEEFTDEVIVGLHESGLIFHEGLNISQSRSYCSHCKNKIHCFVKIDRETKEAEFNMSCTNNICRCNCRTHYACKQCGRLHPYAQKCNNIEIETKPSPESDIIFNKIISDWKELDESQPITEVKTK